MSCFWSFIRFIVSLKKIWNFRGKIEGFTDKRKCNRFGSPIVYRNWEHLPVEKGDRQINHSIRTQICLTNAKLFIFLFHFANWIRTIFISKMSDLFQLTGTKKTNKFEFTFNSQRKTTWFIGVEPGFGVQSPINGQNV